MEISSAQAKTAGAAVFTVANPTEVDFYSSFNVLGQTNDGSGTHTLELTRIDLSGSTPY